MWKSKLRAMLVCVVLQMGVFGQVPMRPDEIQALMHQMNQPRLAHVLPGENDQGDEPPEG